MVNQIVVLLNILSDRTNRKKVTKADNLLARKKFQKHGRNSAMVSIKEQEQITTIMKNNYLGYT